ncbi:hypothetical protein Hanom_Chr10g00942831 [Helianthus anomalus]
MVFFLRLIMDKVEDKIHEAPHPEGPWAPPPSVDPLHGHAYLELTPGTDSARFCGKLRMMHVGSHVAVDWMHWRPLLAHTSSYRELLVEFLSTFTFHPPRADQPPTQPQAPPPSHEVSLRLASV